MGLTVKTRVSKKNLLYIPKSIAEAVGLKEGATVKLTVRGSKIIVEVVPDPFDLALKYPKFAKISFEEFEKDSEEMQRELFKE